MVCYKLILWLFHALANFLLLLWLYLVIYTEVGTNRTNRQTSIALVYSVNNSEQCQLKKKQHIFLSYWGSVRNF